MIFLHHAKLVILSQPKTGSTAIDRALSPRASMLIKSPPRMKHLTYGTFMETLAPWIKSNAGLGRKEYEVWAIMREPIDWMGSWYRYRTRTVKAHNRDALPTEKSTRDMSFEDFMLEACKDESEKAPFARLGKPYGVSQNGPETIGVDRLFPYEDLSGFHALIEKKTGEPLITERLNASPERELELSKETEAKVRERFAFSFDLHSSLIPNGKVEERFRSPSRA